MMYKIKMVICNGKTPVCMISTFSDGVDNYQESVLGKQGMKKKIWMFRRDWEGGLVKK